MKRPIQLLLHLQSPKWISAIKRTFPDAESSWSLTVSSLVEESELIENGSIIVEPSPENAVDFAKKISVLHNNSRNWAMFAVGEICNEIRPLLRQSGFAAAFNSLLEIGHLRNAVERHHECLPARSMTIEERISSSLPWDGAMDRLQS